ncbi:MAG: restriction endonuclease [Candidatus Nitrotoga sp.]
MADPSSQKIADWVIEFSQPDWKRLNEICYESIRGQWLIPSDDYVADVVARELPYVKTILNEMVGTACASGETLLFEIDEDEIPYVRGKNKDCFDVLRCLRKIDPDKFEEVCAEILKEFGGASKVTGMPNDGGVDFIGFNLSLVGMDFPTPESARMIVIGQAKRYKEGNTISESELRKFVGGATRRVHQLKREERIGALTPVVYAFWTSSDFERNAKNYSQEVGLWLMNGVTMSQYLIQLKMTQRLGLLGG